jgi:hypothetical protein
MGLTDIAPATVLRQVPAPGGGEIEGSAQVEWPESVRAEQNFRHTDCPDDRAWQIAVLIPQRTQRLLSSCFLSASTTRT